MNQKKVKIYLDENGIPFSDFDLKNKIISINGDYQGSINASELLVYIENIDNSVSSVANITSPSGKTYTYVMGDYSEDGINFKKLPFSETLQSENGKYDISISIFDEAYEYISIIPNSYSPTAISSITFQSISGHKYYYEYSGIYGIVTATSSSTTINLSSSSTFFSIDLSDYGFSSYTEEQAHSLFSPRYDDLINGTECGFILYLGEDQPTSLASQTFSFYVSNAPVSSNARNISNPTEDVWIQIMSALSSLSKTESKLFTTDGNMTLSTAISSYGRCFFFNDTAVKSPISNGDLWHLFIVSGSSGSYEIMSMEYDSNGKTCIKFAQNSGTGTLTYILNSLENKTKAVYDENGNNIVNTYLSQSYASSTYETLVGSASKLSEAKTYANGVGTAITNTKGQANGICPLDANAKILVGNIPDSLLGSLLYGGTFLPSTGVATVTDQFKSKYSYSQNTLTITSGNASLYQGVFFVAQDSATFLSIDFVTKDWIISNGSSGWAKIDNTDPPSVLRTSNLSLSLASAITSLGREIAVDGAGGSYIAVVWLNGSNYDGRFVGTQKNGIRSFFGLSGTTTLADAFTASVTDYAKLISGADYAYMVGTASVYNAGYYEIIDSSSSTYQLGNIYFLNSSGVSSQITSSDVSTLSITKANKLVLTNAVSGGSFAVGSTAGWTASGCTLSATSGELVATSTGGYSYYQAYYNFSFTVGHKYYIRFTYHSSADVTSANVRFIYGDGEGALQISDLVPGSTTTASLTFSTVALLPFSAYSKVGLSVRANNATPTAGSTIAIDNVVLVDCSLSMGMGNECSPSYLNDTLTALYPSTSGWFEGTIRPFDLIDTCMRKENKIAVTNRYYDPDFFSTSSSYHIFANCSATLSSRIITMTGDGTTTSFSIDNADSVKYVPSNPFRKFYGSIWVQPASLTGFVSAVLSLVVKDSSNNTLATIQMASVDLTTIPIPTTTRLTTTAFTRIFGMADFTSYQASYPTAYKVGMKLTLNYDTNAHQAVAVQIKKPLFVDLTDSYGKDMEPTSDQFSNTLMRYSDYWLAGTEDVLSIDSIDDRLYAIETNQPLSEKTLDVSAIIAGTDPYFFIASGVGTSGSHYVIKPRPYIRHSMNRYSVNITTEPSATLYIDLAPYGSQSVMVFINKNIRTDGWTNHYHFNVLDHSGYARYRYSSGLPGMTNAEFTSASTLLYHACFDANADEIYSTVIN